MVTSRWFFRVHNFSIFLNDLGTWREVSLLCFPLILLPVRLQLSYICFYSLFAQVFSAPGLASWRASHNSQSPGSPSGDGWLSHSQCCIVDFGFLSIHIFYNNWQHVIGPDIVLCFKVTKFDSILNPNSERITQEEWRLKKSKQFVNSMKFQMRFTWWIEVYGTPESDTMKVIQ